MRKIWLKNFTSLNPCEKELVLQWRNCAYVAKFMRNTQISKKEHLEFLKSLQRDSSKCYFLVFENSLPIGVIDFVHIKQESCEFGLYQNPDLKGYGSILMEQILHYAFKVLGVQTLYACAFKTNQKAISLYLKYNLIQIKEDKEMCYFSLRGGGAKS